MATLTHSSASRRLRRVAGHAFGMAAIVVVMLIGNLRVQASEPRSSGSSPDAAFAPVNDARAEWRLAATSSGSAGEDVADAVEVVPAIYAWNPDVRFVYFRHVSKWM